MVRFHLFLKAFQSRMVRGTFVLFMLLLLCGLSAAPLAYAQTLSFEKTWGGTGNEYGNGVAIDGSGNSYVTGYTGSFGAGGDDVVLLKFDSSGGLLWQKTWGSTNNDYGDGVAVDSSDNIFVTGYTYGFGAGGTDVVLLKFDSSGGLVWQKTWGSTNNDYGDGVAVDSSDNIFVTGYTYGFGAGGTDVVLLKFDSSGGLVWQKTWGGTDDDGGSGVAIDGSGNIYVTGYTGSFGAGGYDVVLLKFDSSGGLVWQKTWGGANTEDGMGVAVDSSGNIFVTGYTGSFGAGSGDVLVLKFDSSGGLVWQKTWGSTNYDEGDGVAVDGSGNIYVASKMYGFYGTADWDALLLKYDSSGNVVWLRTWRGPDSELVLAVAARGGYVYFTGGVDGAESNLDAVSGTVTTPSGSVGSPTFDPRTPTFTLGTPTFTLGTPSGSETYAGGADVFLLRFSLGASIETLQGFADLPARSVLLVVGDLALNPHGSKPSGVSYQQGRDTTPLGFVYGMMVNVQPFAFDTNARMIDNGTGRPHSGEPYGLIFSIGGPGINSVTNYYETTSNATDMAPVRFGYNSTHFWWALTSNGTKVYTGLQSDTSVPPGTSDVFVIQILRDADGRLVVLMYGTRYMGTWAAAWYFKFIFYPNISTNYGTGSYYIVKWIDQTGWYADFAPNYGDTFTILAHG